MKASKKSIMKSLIFYFLIVSISLFGFHVFAAEGNSNLIIKGKVVDPQGQNFTAGSIIDINDANGKWIDHVFSDNQGEFIITGLSDGNYKLIALPDNASGYAVSEFFNFSIVNGKYSGSILILKLLNAQVKGIVIDSDGKTPDPWTFHAVVTKTDGEVVKDNNVYGDGSIRFAGLSDGVYKVKAYPFSTESKYGASKAQRITIVNGVYSGPELKLLITEKNKPVSAATYYIDYSEGDDNNDGISPSTPWKTISRVNDETFNPGDSILFKRGEVWREKLVISSSGNSGKPIVFGAYGIGKNPIIMGSVQCNKETDWTNIGKNLWATVNGSFPGDSGFMMLGTESHDNVGIKCDYLNKPNLLRGAVDKDKEYYHDSVNGRVILYCKQNPAIKYKSIEIAYSPKSGNVDLISIANQNFITIENLSVKYFNAHGIGLSNNQGIVINNCNISFGGGQFQIFDQKLRYGNGIQFWETAKDCTVEGCNIWEIYDAGVTNQGYGTNNQSNITYQNNLIWNCEYCYELWNRPGTSTLKNISFVNNICAGAGYGWGNRQRKDPGNSANLKLWDSSAVSNNIKITDNIFYEAVDNCFYLDPRWEYPKALILTNNLYYKSSGFIINYMDSKYLVARFSQYQKEKGKDLNSKSVDLKTIKKAITVKLNKRDKTVVSTFTSSFKLN